MRGWEEKKSIEDCVNVCENRFLVLFFQISSTNCKFFPFCCCFSALGFMAMCIKLLCKYINKTKLCGRWIRWSMVGHLLWTTMWLQPSAGPVSIHRSHSLAFCRLDWRPRSASWTLSVSHCCFYSCPQTLHLSVSAPTLLLQITAQTSRPPLSHEGHTHKHTHTHTKLNYRDGMGRGSEREIGQSACTPPLLNPLTVLAGQESGAGKGTHTHTHKHTHTHTHTHTHINTRLQMGNMCVWQDGTCWGSEGMAALCYVINSTFRLVCDRATDQGLHIMIPQCKGIKWRLSGQFRFTFSFLILI